MKILCAGGGTLGSVVPLLAVVEELRKRDNSLEVEWWGTENGPERKLVEFNNIPFKTISAGKFRRYISGENLKDFGRIGKGFVEATWRLGLVKPNCLLTAGSYVAVPVGWAAYMHGVPVFLHQQDIRPSLANKLMLPIAKKITVTIEKSIQDFKSRDVILTGNPVRTNFLNPPTTSEAKKILGLSNDKPVVLFIGGGTGAEKLNKLVASSRNELIKNWQVLHLTGENKGETTTANDYHVSSFTNESINYLSAADVVITRAGMSSLTELAALSKAAVVVPIPNSHQVDNAEYFSQKSAVMMISQSELTVDKLLATLGKLHSDTDSRNKLGHNLQNAFLPDASQRVADVIMNSLDN